MSSISILHNPRCSKSRQTLALLQEKNLDIDVIEYLKTPLSAADLTELKTKLGFSSYLEMMRTKEAEFKELNLSKDSNEEQLLAAMVSTPKLIERPVVVTDSAAKIGRPPESVLSILE